jgi:hypothetical protein
MITTEEKKPVAEILKTMRVGDSQTYPINRRMYLAQACNRFNVLMKRLGVRVSLRTDSDNGIVTVTRVS